MLTPAQRRTYYQQAASSILWIGDGSTMICCELERFLYIDDIINTYAHDYTFILGVYFPEMWLISEDYPQRP